MTLGPAPSDRFREQLALHCGELATATLGLATGAGSSDPDRRLLGLDVADMFRVAASFDASSVAELFSTWIMVFEVEGRASYGVEDLYQAMVTAVEERFGIADGEAFRALMWDALDSVRRP